MQEQATAGPIAVPRRDAAEGEGPQRRTAQGRARGVNYGVTRQQALDLWGRAVASDHQRGRSVFQNPQTLRPAQSMPSLTHDEAGQVQRKPPNTFRGTNAIILRTVAAQRGITDTRFLMPEAARRFNEQHGHTVRNPVVNRAGRIELPNSNSKADEPYVERHQQRLEADGPNHDAGGVATEGKKGDLRRDEAGKPVLEDIVYHGLRRDSGVREYYNVDDLRLPARQPRPVPAQSRVDGMLGSLTGPAKRAGLVTVDTEQLNGRAELSLIEDGDKQRFELRVAPKESFESEQHYESAVVHELCRYAACRDSNADALAVAKAKPEDRPGMPEFARSELVVSAASMELMTEAGHRWQPPSYGREQQREIRAEQIRTLREPSGLAELGLSASRTLRVAANRAPTVYDQRQRNLERRQMAPSVESVARGFAGRQAAAVAPAAPAPERAAPSRSAPSAPSPDEIADRRNAAAERAAADLYDGRKRSASQHHQPVEDDPTSPSVADVQAKLDQLIDAKPSRPVAEALGSRSFDEVVASTRSQVEEPGRAPAPASGASRAAAAGPDRGASRQQ